MSLRILTALTFALLLSGTAAADGPVRKLLKKSQPAAPTLSYAEAYEKAKTGRFVLAVGVPPKDPINFYGAPVFACTGDSPCAFATGHYQCGPSRGVPFWWTPGMERQAPMPVPVKAIAAAPPVAASRDRLKDYLLAEIAKLHAAEKAGKLTPEQWDRLKALIELLLRLAPLFFDSP